eukprot:1940095-Rhodomonas_salina.2
MKREQLVLVIKTMQEVLAQLVHRAVLIGSKSLALHVRMAELHHRAPWDLCPINSSALSSLAIKSGTPCIRDLRLAHRHAKMREQTCQRGHAFQRSPLTLSSPPRSCSSSMKLSDAVPRNGRNPKLRNSPSFVCHVTVITLLLFPLLTYQYRTQEYLQWPAKVTFIRL